jgi:hypothetical protein
LDANRTIGQPSKITTILVAGNTFTTAELYPYVLAALQISADQYCLASLRYDLRKLRAKHLVEKFSKSRRYRLPPTGLFHLLGVPKTPRTGLPGRWLPAYFNPTGVTPNSRTTNEPNWIDSNLSKDCR